MTYIRTKMATDWPQKERWIVRLFRLLLWFIPQDREFDSKLHLVKEWLIEFDEKGEPMREIGLGADGVPVLAGGLGSGHYGFWLDTNYRLEDFDDEEIDSMLFDKLWIEYLSVADVRHKSKYF